MNHGWPSWEQCSQDGPFVKKHKLFYNFIRLIRLRSSNFIQTALVAYLIYYDRLIGYSSPAVAPHWPRSAAANIAVLPPMTATAPPSSRSGNSMGSPCQKWHRRGSAVVPPWFSSITAKKNTCVTGMEKLWKTTGGVTTVMAVLIKNRSGAAPPVWRGYNVWDARGNGWEKASEGYRWQGSMGDT